MSKKDAHLPKFPVSFHQIFWIIMVDTSNPSNAENPSLHNSFCHLRYYLKKEKKGVNNCNPHCPFNHLALRTPLLPLQKKKNKIGLLRRSYRTIFKTLKVKMVRKRNTYYFGFFSRQSRKRTFCRF